MYSKLKRLLCMVLCAVMLFGLIPTTLVSAAESGTCGTGLNWSFDKDTGRLTITGTGNMMDFTADSTPWISMNADISTVILEEGVTSVGDYAFYNLDGLVSVTFPDTLVRIGSHAFAGCDGLTCMTLHGNLKEVANAAFADCKLLNTVIFEGHAPEISDNAFTGLTIDVFYRDSSTSWTTDTVRNYGGDTIWYPNTQIPCVEMYRLYNPNSGEHFYTGSEEERDNLIEAGWQYEGVAWNAPVKGGDPVYRVYNPVASDHHYTMSWEEVENLVDVGWQYEGVCWNSADADGIYPMYRLYNPNAYSGAHHYTGSEEERDNLKQLGWHYEGIGWYGAMDQFMKTNYYFVTFETNGGSQVEELTVERGEKATAPEDPTLDGYIFVGWYSDEELTELYDFTTPVNENNVLYAKWEESGIANSVKLRLSEVECSVISGSSRVIYFYAEPNGTVDGVTLMNAETDEVLLTLVDDGKYSDSGDDLPGDNIYSGKMSVNTSEAKEYAYYAATTGDKVLTSDIVKLRVYGGFNAEDLEKMDTVKESLASSVFDNENFDTMTTDEKKVLAEDVLEDLAEQNMVVDNSILYNEDTEAFTFTYDSGVLGIISLKEMDSELNGFAEQIEDISETTEANEPSNAETVAVEDPQENPETVSDADSMEDDQNVSEVNEDTVVIVPTEVAEGEENPYYHLWQERMNADQAITRPAVNSAADVVEKIGEAIVLWSFNQVTDNLAYREPFYNTLETDLEALGLDTTVSWNTTVNEYKKLKGYDVILFSGHGSNYSFYTVDGAKATLPTMLLSEEPTQAKYDMYESDLLGYRVCEFTFSYKDSNNVKQYKTVYGILPNFFDYYYDSDDLDGSFIFAENCMFRGKNNVVSNLFSDKLLATSAESVIGFHNSVMADYSRELMKEYVIGLCSGETADEAFETAKDIYDEDDYNYRKNTIYAKEPTAYPLFSGNKDATLIKTGIQNGDFEESTTATSWSQVGDIRVLTQLASLAPTSKNRMAILTTGIGSAEKDYLAGTEGSVLSQQFKIPEDAETLVFSYDVVSEEPMEFVGSSYNDGFQAKLITEKETLEMASEYINTSTWYSIDGIDFDGGDSTTYHTTWKTVSLDVSKYAGQIVTIQFVVYDVGDSIYDTAALIDNVYLK